MNPDDAPKMSDDVVKRWVDRAIKRDADQGNFGMKKLLEYRRASSTPGTYWHGGYPGLKAFDTVLPPSSTGYVSAAVVIRERKVTSLLHLSSATYDPSFVYVTTNRALARDHAAGWSNWNFIRTGIWEPGRLYSVTPVSVIIPDFVPPVCCCGTHGAGSVCCFKTTSAIVDYVDDELILPVQSSGWKSIGAILSNEYEAWTKEKG